MIKQKTILEMKVNDRTYELQCEPCSPLGELYDVISSMRAHVLNLIQDAENKENKSSCCGENNE